MSDNTGQKPDLEALKDSVRQAVESGNDMQARVRELTLTALSSGQLDLQHIRLVTRAVIEGIREAAANRSVHATMLIQQSLRGLEDALSQAGEASVLAVREAAGRAGEFASQDLKQAMDELASLQHVYADALGEVVADVARAGADTLSAIFEDMHRHARHSGASFAGQISDSLEGLRKLLPSGGLHTGAGQMYGAADTLGKIAGGILRGIQQGFGEQPVSPTGEAGDSRSVQSPADKKPSDDGGADRPGG